ncbi:MAG: cysteine--tRNA ligase [Bacteroidota bacterium]
MKDLHVFNSLARKKELFEPLSPPFVGMYVCGPTVYGPAHLGHARSAITFDIVFRYLTFLGYKVRYVRNITDVGHLVNDADAGESKIERQARLERLEPMEVAQRYYNSYISDMNALNLIRPSIEPRATGHITEQIEAVQQILDNGYAYVSDGSVYFDVSSYNEDFEYGKLSGRDLDNILNTSRDNLVGQSGKKNPADFAIWKKAEDNHIMRWNSPWGEGFPGWHIECTVMSTKYLGEKYDIHGGGMDLLFPHHEAEIAQSNACNKHRCKEDQDEAKYWLHNNMITYEGKKMGKSLGNAINLKGFFNGIHWTKLQDHMTVKDGMELRDATDTEGNSFKEINLLVQPFTPMTIRFFILQAHYRSTLDFSNEALQATEKALKRMNEAIKRLQGIKFEGKSISINEEFEKNLASFLDDVKTEMNDDFNTAKVIARMFDTLSVINQLYNEVGNTFAVSVETFAKFRHDFLTVYSELLGMSSDDDAGEDGSETLDGVMNLLIELRAQARKEKNWGLSDKIRDELNTLKIRLEDSPKGTDWFVES